MPVPTRVATSRPEECSGQRTSPPATGMVAPNSTITSAIRTSAEPPTTQVSSEAGPAAAAACIGLSSQPEPITPPKAMPVSCQKPRCRRKPSSGDSSSGPGG